MIYKILRHSDLYHTPDPLFRLVGEVNETTVIVEGQEARALIDSGSQHFISMGKEIKLETHNFGQYCKLKVQED